MNRAEIWWQAYFAALGGLAGWGMNYRAHHGGHGQPGGSGSGSHGPQHTAPGRVESQWVQHMRLVGCLPAADEKTKADANTASSSAFFMGWIPITALRGMRANVND